MESSTCALASNAQPMEVANDIFHIGGVAINEDVWYEILHRCYSSDLPALEQTDADLAYLLNHRIFRTRFPLTVMEDYRKNHEKVEGSVPNSLIFGPQLKPASDSLRAALSTMVHSCGKWTQTEEVTWASRVKGDAEGTVSPLVEWKQFRVQDSAHLSDALIVRGSRYDVSISLDIFKYFPRWMSAALPGARLKIRFCGFLNDFIGSQPLSTRQHEWSLPMHFKCVFMNPRIADSDPINLFGPDEYDASRKYKPIVSAESVSISDGSNLPKRFRHFEYTFEAELKENTEFAIRCRQWVAITELSASIEWA